MTPYYNENQLIAKLVAESRRWIGTPFMTNGRTIQEGVDCHNLAYALHRATGAWPEFEVPRGRSGIAGQVQVRRMSDFFATLPFMVGMDEGETPLPGDILTGLVRGVEAHMIIYLGFVDGQKKTCVTAMRGGVRFVNLLDPTWAVNGTVWRTFK